MAGAYTNLVISFEASTNNYEQRIIEIEKLHKLEKQLQRVKSARTALGAAGIGAGTMALLLAFFKYIII